MAFGHLVVRVAHDGGAVHVFRDRPAEALIQQVVFRRGGEIFTPAHHVGDAHQMVVHHVGEVVGRHPVPLDEDLVVQGAVFNGNVAEDLIVEGRRPLMRDALADHIFLARGGSGFGLFPAEAAAGIVRPVELAGILLALRLLAEAVIGAALFHQQLGVLLVHAHALALDVGGHRPADVRPLVVLEMALGHRAVDHVRRAFDQAATVGVFNAEDELSAGMAGDQVCIQCRAQVAHMHVTRGRGGKTGAHFPCGDLFLVVFKPFSVFHGILLLSETILFQTILYYNLI